LENNEEFDCKDLKSRNPSYEKRLRFWTNDICARAPQTFDIVIALGGDGTVLYASFLFQRIVPPVFSFALGSLGFLTKFDFSSYKDSLSRVFAEGFHVNLRLRFEATIMRNCHKGDSKSKDIVEEIIGRDAANVTHDPGGSHHILNEVVLDRGPNGSKQ
jgi:NAD+ kinase